MKDYSMRLNALSKEMEKGQIPLVLTQDPKDILYLTGCTVSRGTLFIHNKGASFFVDGRYFEACKQSSVCEVILESEGRLKEFLAPYKKAKSPLSKIDAKQYLSWEKKFHLQLEDTSLIDDLRNIKSKGEMEHMKKSAEVLWLSYLHVVTLLKEGVSEKDLACEFEYHAKQLGAKGVSFEPIVAFNEHSALPHHHCTTKKLTPNSWVLLDLGVEYEGYASDMTRCVPFGQVRKEILEIEKVVKEAYKQAFLAVHDQVKAKDVDHAARDHIAQKGFGEYFTHSLGHGIGLDVHEPISLSMKSEMLLQTGMCFTIEPGIYLPNIGGVRYENEIYLSDQGPQSLFPVEDDVL